MGFLLTLLAATAAVGVEMLEALAIVMAVGLARGFRDALAGAAAAAVAVVALCLALGPALLSGADLGLLRVIIGTLLMLFGLEWMRKGILRSAGRLGHTTAYEEFVEERESLAHGGPQTDWAARLVAFKGVFLEGLEVGLIVLALGGTPGRLAPALLGTAVAIVAVIAVGVLAHAPLRRLPEVQLKLAVGIALTTFGTFFCAEGLRVDWPLGDGALLYLVAALAAFALVAVRRLEARPRAVAEATP